MGIYIYMYMPISHLTDPLTSHQRDSVPVLLGVATAHVVLHQVPRARNHLKRIAKTQWNSQVGVAKVTCPSPFQNYFLLYIQYSS